MKKAKQILAIIGIIILVGLYGLTLFAAIFDNSNTMVYFQAAVLATIIVPVLLWVVQMLYKQLPKPRDDMDSIHTTEDEGNNTSKDNKKTP